MKKPDLPPALPIDLIREGTAVKLSPKSQGDLRYEIGIHNDDKAIYLRIASNSSGGYFSAEWVSVEAIERCLGDKVSAETPLNSRVLRSAFLQGKSANNAGFLAAILRQEKLLSPHQTNSFQHHLTGDIAQWKKQLLAGRRKRAAKADPAAEKP